MFFENSGPAFDWLAIDHGIQFDFEPKPGFTPSDHYEVKFQWYPNKPEGQPDAPINGAIPQGKPLPEAYDVLDVAIERGFVFKADTIDVNPAALAETVEAYNGYCENGEDKEFGKDSGLLEAIGEGPYYAVKMASYSYNTCAGLDVNPQLQVLDTSGQPIEGLYAVGSDSAGVLFSEKKPYVTYGGANNGWVLASGYVAGEVVADYVKSK